MEALNLKIPRDGDHTKGALKSLLELAQDDPARDWNTICGLLSRCVESDGPAATLDPAVMEQLADLHVYVELGESNGARRFRCRPTIQRLKQEAEKGRFTRLFVSSVSSLGADVREVVSVVSELVELGLTIIPARSDAECADPSMMKVLRLVESWCRELDHERRSAAIKAGQRKTTAKGKRVGRPKRIFDREEVVRLRDEEHLSWPRIAQALGIGVGTARRAYQELATPSRPAKTIREVA